LVKCPESYAGGSVATARQDKDVTTQTKRDTLVLQIEGWAWVSIPHPITNMFGSISFTTRAVMSDKKRRRIRKRILSIMIIWSTMSFSLTVKYIELN
jgi:hypothetical protein